MKLSDLRDSLDEEVSTILSAAFTIDVTETTTVPHSGDAAITFPNLDGKRQSCKLIDTCVLYIDIRRSTDLSLRLRPKTVTKLYSAFVRSMTRCARQCEGHVRGIIGDRVMVLFDQEDAFGHAVDCAILMHSTAKYIINKHFKSGEVTCGIGIDSGKMLVTKTGIRKNGLDLQNYRNLVWLGKPANIASKLTDVANKPMESMTLDKVRFARQLPGTTNTDGWYWSEEYPQEFVKRLGDESWPTYLIKHKDPSYRAFYMTTEFHVIRESTPPILMSERVWKGLSAAHPTDDRVTKGWFAAIKVELPGGSQTVYGGNVIKTVFEPTKA